MEMEKPMGFCSMLERSFGSTWLRLEEDHGSPFGPSELRHMGRISRSWLKTFVCLPCVNLGIVIGPVTCIILEHGCHRSGGAHSHQQTDQEVTGLSLGLVLNLLLSYFITEIEHSFCRLKPGQQGECHENSKIVVKKPRYSARSNKCAGVITNVS
ncbi:hypothetical protein F2Q69_00001104 [Brassica cretica]|uniref:Uncharacterized protein n=1 Tax=Brassica cretica TaxID=69181 RepID=A0A8S9NYZ7_BRACR|nr:hypothetical protein F2Q69_00001104 [Brassica cretica]